MLKYVTKLAMEIVPSVVATILGAYIVNHYINAKPDPTAAAAVSAASTADVKATGSKAAVSGLLAKVDSSKDDPSKTDQSKTEAKPGAGESAKPAEASAERSNLPGPGIKARGIAEKSVVEKPAEVKPADLKPTETASLPAESTRHSAAKDKPVARTAPSESQPSAEEHRDAADLARAAIQRLRASEGGRERASEASRIVVNEPVSPVRPLPPPVSVSAPRAEGFGPGPLDAAGISPAYTGSVQADGRITPPAEIPLRPLDLRADGDTAKERMSNVAQDVLTAAKSMFHSVIPK
jgi:hypothetical protein